MSPISPCHFNFLKFPDGPWNRHRVPPRTESTHLFLGQVVKAVSDDEGHKRNEGLGLDSIDALELGVALKKKFGIKFTLESEDAKKVFSSVNSIAEYIFAERAKEK